MLDGAARVASVGANPRGMGMGDGALERSKCPETSDLRVNDYNLGENAGLP